LDIERKYIRTFTGESVDNSKPKSDVQYLRDMMQGRKKYQRRQWVRDQEIYFGTKNLMNTVVGDNNRITFRCFTPTGDDVVVPPDYTLKITPYSDMYLSVMFGNGGTQQVRAKGGTEYTIECPLSTMDDTQVTIYGANRIQALNDLSACYITANNFSMATKLRTLVLGNTTEGYNNSRLISLTLGNNELLEELDIRNCANLTGSLNLAQCANLLRLYAEGTKLTGVTFATNGKVQLAHLPNTVNTLTMRNLNDLDDFEANLSSLETLTLQGGTLDSLDVISDCIDTLRVLNLYDIDWTLSDTELLNAMKSLFYSLVTGQVYISGQVRQQELNGYAAAWSDLEVTYNPENLVTQYKVTYVNADANDTVLYETYVDRGSTPPDPYALGLITKPILSPDAQYTYSFGTTVGGEYQSGSGWDDLTSAILADKTITAVYTRTLRTYTVTWYSRPGLSLGSVEANYGDEVVYEGSIPTNTTEESTYIFNVFAGWDKSTGFIKEDTDVYAVWDRAELPAVGKDMSEMSCAEIFAVCSTGSAAQHFEDKDHFDITLGHDFDFSNVESEVILENRYFDGTQTYDTDITLFDEDSPSFTLAIDSEFHGSNDANASLVSCFDESGSEGFRLKYNTNPTIQWGDKSITAGCKTNRTMCVIRHIKGSDKLFVYVSNLGDTTYDDVDTKVESIRTRNTSSSNVLSFGAIRFVGDGGHDYYAKGWIHWCKIWFDDLGDENAKMLAAFPHEKLRMEFAGANRYRLSGQTRQRANGSFIANNPLTLLHNMNASSTNVGGWDECKMRTFLATRILKAIPTKWRSALKEVKIFASAGNKSSEIVVSEDILYLAANREVGGNTTEPYASEGTAISFFTNDKSRVKFPGVVIEDDAQYITSNTDPTTSSSYDIQEGDVWIHSGNSNIGYIYFSAATKAKHSRIGFRDVTNGDNIQASNGGLWYRADYWWERSPNVGNAAYFCLVHSYGSPSYGTAYNNTYGVVVGFSI
jgi:hypothetical protein